MARTEQGLGSGRRRTLDALAHPERFADDPERLAYVRALTQTLGEGVMAADDSGCITFMNRAAEDILGWREGDVIGRRAHDVMHHSRADGTPFPYEACPMRRVTVAGETVRMEEDVFVRQDGSLVTVQYVASPLVIEGRVAGTVLSFHDISARHAADEERARLLASERAARERLSFLAAASVELAASVLDYESTLERIANLVVPRVADWCAIDIIETDGSLRRVVTVHPDPAKLSVAGELTERYPPSLDGDAGVARVVRVGRSELYADVNDDVVMAAARDTRHRELLREIGVRAALIVPLVARGRVLGAISFVAAESGRSFEADDVALAEDLARRAGMAIDNARLYADRARVARTLQQTLLPPDLPTMRGLEVSGRYHAAGEGNEVGGDFYDAFRTGRRRWMLVMGDVCGKGPEAAALTGLARHTIRGAAMQERSPSRILRMLNTAMLQQRTDERFLTAAVASIERTAAGVRITVASGGHPWPIVVRADGVVEPIEARGTLLGVFPDPALHEVELRLEPGDAIVLFTDGVTEARNDESAFGYDRLVDLLRECTGFSAAEIAERVERAVVTFQNGVVRDDVALLVLKAVR